MTGADWLKKFADSVERVETLRVRLDSAIAERGKIRMEIEALINRVRVGNEIVTPDRPIDKEDG